MDFKAEQKKAFKETLIDFLSVSSPSGREYPMVEHLKPKLKQYADDVFEDNFGNLIVHVGGSGKKLMFSAHIDELGFIIKSISSDGFLYFSKVGGHPAKILEARQVLVNGTIPGIIGSKPGHLQTPEEMLQVTPEKELFIDIGASSKEEVLALGIDIGSYANMRYNYMEFHNPDFISCRTLDDRAGSAVLFELLKSIDKSKLCYDLYLVFSLQEEVGLRGAQAAANYICPDIAIALDTMPCADYPGINWQRDLPIQLGKGVCCNISEGQKPMTFMHPKLMQFITGTAEKHGIAYQKVSVCGISCASDASQMVVSGRGSHSGALTIPRRYSHSPVEMMHIHDALCMLELAKKLVETEYPV